MGNNSSSISVQIHLFLLQHLAKKSPTFTTRRSIYLHHYRRNVRSLEMSLGLTKNILNEYFSQRKRIALRISLLKIFFYSIQAIRFPSKYERYILRG